MSRRNHRCAFGQVGAINLPIHEYALSVVIRIVAAGSVVHPAESACAGRGGLTVHDLVGSSQIQFVFAKLAVAGSLGGRDNAPRCGTVAATFNRGRDIRCRLRC
jgi:hypothetical protein